jgi:tetratricopeptide (TPR) repeat protein
MNNPFSSGQVPSKSSESFEERITTLLEEVDLAIKWDRPSILLAVYASEVINNLAQESLEKQIEWLGQKVTRIKVDKENFDLAWFLSQFEQHEKVVFFITGLRWGGGRSRSNAYQALNMRRELFVEEKIRLVIWLNQKEASDLPHLAPDFWAFRHRVVEFPDITSAIPSSFRDDFSWRDWQVNETPHDLKAKIALRESMLADLPVSDSSLFTRTDLMYALAFFYWCQQEYDRAASYLDKGLDLTTHPQATPIQAKFKIALGMLYHDQSMLDKALVTFQQVIEQEPRNPSAWNNLALVFHDQGRQADALHAFKKAIKLSPRYANAWNNLGNYHRENGNKPDALHAFKQATRFEPQNAKPWINLAHTHLDAGQPDLAIRAYKKAIRLVPENAVLLNDLGNIYREMNRFKDAISSYNKAIKIAPGYALPYAGLVACYRKMGRSDAAKKHFDLAQPLLENQAEIIRAEFEALCGNNQAAIRFLKVALDENQVNPNSIRTNPNFNGLHSDTRYQDLIEVFDE